MRKVLVVSAALLLSVSSLSFGATATKAASEEKATAVAKPAKADATEKPATAANSELKTFSAKVGYMIGKNIGGSLKEVEGEFDMDTLIRGIKDGLAGKEFLLSDQEMMGVQKELMTKMQDKAKAEGEKSRKEGEAFLAANKIKAGVITTSSGLEYMVVKEGTGPKPTENDQVAVNYRGTFIEGKEFDSSKPDMPTTFRVKGVIPGMTEALQLMKVGGKYRLFIPSDLAYGPEGRHPVVPPNATLIFDIELLKTEKAPEMPAMGGMGGVGGAMPPGHPDVK